MVDVHASTQLLGTYQRIYLDNKLRPPARRYVPNSFVALQLTMAANLCYLPDQAGALGSRFASANAAMLLQAL
jgi:hypothetical protein